MRFGEWRSRLLLQVKMYEAPEHMSRPHLELLAGKVIPMLHDRAEHATKAIWLLFG